ncbi:MAG: hypothetical protein AABX04_02090 [Nanoarchaeota archaeon]
MAYLKNGFTRTLSLILLIIIGSCFALAENVAFTVDVPSSVTVGNTFDIKVLLDIPSTIPIKQAEFILTPSAGVTINSAVSEGLFSGATVTYNQKEGSGFHYGETTTGTEIYGTNKLFVTLKATAVSPGSVTLTFSGLVAKKGNFARTTTSLAKSFIILATPTQTCSNNKKEGSEVCDGTDLSGQTCVSQGFASGNLNCKTDCSGFDTTTCVASCVDRAVTACVDGWKCPENIEIKATGKCSEGQTCQKGVCIKSVICEDSDNGMDSSIKGIVKGSLACNGLVVTYTDTCLDANTVQEYYCGYYEECANGKIGGSSLPCSSGTLCIDGVCITSPPVTCTSTCQNDMVSTSCSDGTTSNVNCVNSGKVCIDGECKNKEEACSPGREYSNGVCLFIGDLNIDGKVNGADLDQNYFKPKIKSLIHDLSKLNKFLWAFKHNYDAEVGQ